MRTKSYTEFYNEKDLQECNYSDIKESTHGIYFSLPYYMGCKISTPTKEDYLIRFNWREYFKCYNSVYIDTLLESGSTIHSGNIAFERCIKDTFEDEIADAFLRLMDLCGAMNIDIEKHIRMKAEYNKLRPTKHGKAY